MRTGVVTRTFPVVKSIMIELAAEHVAAVVPGLGEKRLRAGVIGLARSQYR